MERVGGGGGGGGGGWLKVNWRLLCSKIQTPPFLILWFLHILFMKLTFIHLYMGKLETQHATQ